RVVSPGTLTDTGYLDAREPAFLMAIAPPPPVANRRPQQAGDRTNRDRQGETTGVAPPDLSTGEFSAPEYADADGAPAPADEGTEGGREGSLLNELDRTVTSMGSRLLRGWLMRPLVTLEPIRDRLDAVEELAYRSTERGKLRDAVATVLDLERLVARAALGTA